MRLKHKIVVVAADDTDMKDVLFGIDETLAQVTIDAFDHVTSGNFTVAAEATDAMPKGDVVAIKGIYLKVSGDCVVALSDDIEIPVELAPDQKFARMFLEGTFTKLEITAPLEVTTPLKGTYCMWGDETE